MGVEGIEPNRATTSHAFERKGFTDPRLELLPKLAHRKRLERLSLGLESKVLPLNERCINGSLFCVIFLPELGINWNSSRLKWLHQNDLNVHTCRAGLHEVNSFAAYH